jgi:chromosome partitioning protein
MDAGIRASNHLSKEPLTQVSTYIEEHPMKIFAVANEKGGVGKSTITAQVGVNLDNRGYYTVLIDVDHHRGGIKRWWERRESQFPELLKVTFEQLRPRLDELRELGVDCVVIDTPGWKHEELSKLYEIADLVVVPCQPSPLDLEGTADTFGTLTEHHARSVFLMNIVDKRERITTETVMELSRVGKVAGIVHRATAFKTCMGWGESLDEYDPNHQGVEEIDNLVEFILQEVGIKEPNPVPAELRKPKEKVKKRAKVGPKVAGKSLGVKEGTRGLKLVSSQ